MIILGESALAKWQLIKLVEKLTYTGKLKSLRLCIGSGLVNGCENVSEEQVSQLVQKSTQVDKLSMETMMDIYDLSYLTKMLDIHELHLTVSFLWWRLHLHQSCVQGSVLCTLP